MLDVLVSKSREQSQSKSELEQREELGSVQLAAQRMNIRPGGPRRPRQTGSCGGSPSLGTGPVLSSWRGRGWGASAGGGAMTEGQLLLPSCYHMVPVSHPSCSLNGNGVWVGGGSFRLAARFVK